MRQIKTIISAVLSGALLFTACTKSEQYAVAPSQAATPSGAPIKPANIQQANTNVTHIDGTTGTSASEVADINNVNVSLIFLNSGPSSPMKWASGYLSVGAIGLQTIHIDGNALFKVSYGNKTQKIAQITTANTLGNFSIPGGLYNNNVFTIDLVPLTAQNVMALNGTYVAGNTQWPVQVVSNETMQLTATIPDNIHITDAKYSEMLYLNLDQLFVGIDQGMIENAEKVNGTIVLSSTVNPNLYGMVIANLKNALTVQFK